MSVADGDSIEVSHGRTRLSVRLFGIDSPERGQPYADAAREELRSRVAGKTVRLEIVDRDDYGRQVARVFVGDVDVNAALVRAGAAWVYRKYSHDPELLAAEAEARRAGRGLWAPGAPEPVPPWEWRHGTALARHAARALPSGRPGGSCGAKRYCREMRSCEEARFYLEHCHLSRLDGDGDGVPCETLCRR